jgi:hypothetical protein
MGKEDLIENEIEKTLNSIDGIGRAEANPYLYSKIMNRMDEPGDAIKNFNFKLALTIVVICVLVNLGAFLVLPQYTNTDTTVTGDSREYNIKTFTSEYYSINNIYFY